MEGITKTLVFTGSKGVSAQVTVKETYEIAPNTSVLQVGVALTCSDWGGHIYYLTGSVSAAGQTLQTMSSKDGTHYVYIQNRNTYYPVATDAAGYTGSPWTTAAITHEADGSKTVTVSVSISGYEASGKGASGFSVTGSADISLTHIPRASTIGCADANIGAAAMIAVTRKSTAYTHSIQYAFGELSGYVDENGNPVDSEVKMDSTSIAFRLPTSFYGQIPNGKTGTCTLTCRTYSGNTQIGDAQSCSFTVSTTAESCAPQVQGTVQDANDATKALTGNPSVMVRYMSDALCTLTATPKNGASIVAKAIQGTAISGSTMTISGISDSRIRFAAKDSRGYITDIPVDVSLVPYVMLTCVATGKRNAPTDGTATLAIQGDFFHGSFGAAGNALTLRYRQGSGSWVSLTPTVKDHSYTAAVSLTGLTYTESFTFTVEVSDKLSTVTKTVKIDKGIPVFDWGENDFAFHVPVTFGVGSTLKEIGITAFPTTMKTVVGAMGANTMLMLDSRLIVSGGEQEISDLGIGNAGTYMIFRGNSSARVTLLHIYGAAGATTCYMHYGCYSATNNAVVWLRINEYPYLNTNGFTLSAGASKKFRIDSNILLYGRVNLGVSAMAVYGIGAYSHIRAPIIAELSKGSNITVSSGGDNSSGWYIEVKNTSQGSASFFTVGSAVPVYM